LGIWGPNARAILQKVSSADLGNGGFPYYTGQWIEIGMARVYAMRISYAGELGWELHIPIDSSLPVWDLVWGAGRDFQMIAAGMGAFDSLRLEKGYRLWGGDIYTEYNVYEAGLGWTAKMSKPDFVGKGATASAKAAGLKKKLICLTLTDPQATLQGYEAIFAGDHNIGHVTTANMGYSVGKYIAYAYVPKEFSAEGTQLDVLYFNQRFSAVVTKEPLYDPTMSRLKG
jgi:dimethylglycine oxidase